MIVLAKNGIAATKQITKPLKSLLYRGVKYQTDALDKTKNNTDESVLIRAIDVTLRFRI